ncbi:MULTISPECIES: DUF3080 family protein [unclassified Modicisalibacter]|uniref:DUF3080 family protein n=1 Tax=unclassified Modicisalibacter TaxID=2679913 RepID=UPI001CCD43FB|nr:MULTISPECIES: DUF3080 family protein [unclassified Modicisalibacter]MBZ9560471.1 DUF3080 family protein [Modicisalibacter sp. R2A 31.J]MBZ9575125.1 DUF3080 family protein [Modicisalibacter sp. MOD 31.J]
MTRRPWQAIERPRRRRLPALLPGVLLLGALLAGCQGGSEADHRLIDYQQRLAAALGVEAPATPPPRNIAAFPGRDARRFTIDEIREGLLDVYALRRCGIVRLVAQRNSQLGKVAAPSQRWLYELALWRQLQACWNDTSADDLAKDDRQRLADLLARKTRQLPRASWNGLFDSSEWTGNFSRASAPLPPGGIPSLEAQLAALGYLRRMVLHQYDPRWTPDSATLENHLKALRDAPLTARILRSLLLATRRLDDLDQVIAARLADPAFCAPDTAAEPPVDERLAAALDGQESQRLRADLDSLARDAQRWLTAVDALLSAFTVSRPAIDAYRRHWLSLTHPEAPWPAFRTARAQHAALRERLRQRCLAPAGPSGDRGA